MADFDKFRQKSIFSPEGWFLQRGRIACNAERCNSYSNSICLSLTLVPYPDE